MAISWEHLLGGYATNTLTDEEKRQLFEAALHDQSLFEALANEEDLKSMLADPQARQQILASLQAIGHAGGLTKERGGWLGWFRQPSHLAWAGSLAALGLVLIFGWQMEKEWGPVVSQEQEAAKSSSSSDELVFRPQKPFEERKASVQKEDLKKTATQAEGIEAEPESTPLPAPGVETNKVDRLKQIPALAKKESGAREKGQAIMRQRANEQVAQALSSPSVSEQPKVGRTVQPSAVPESLEVPMADKVPQATAPNRFADQAVGEAPVAPPSAQELFYAASGSLSDEVIGDKNDNDRDDQALRGSLSKTMKPSSKEKPMSFPLQRDFAGGAAIPTARGIRYSFVQHTNEGKDEEVEGQHITGNWSAIRLAVESNVPGYLYVLTSLGNGKWQKLVPIDTAKTVKTEGWINVKSFQRVEFPLGQLTNALGRPVVSAVTVLVSPKPLDDLGQWLGTKADISEVLIEREESAVFVIQPALVKENPLYVEISLVEP